MFPVRMTRLFAVVLEKDAEKVTAELLRHGVMHFINMSKMSLQWVSGLGAVSPQVSLAKIGEMRRRIELFLGDIGIRPRSPGEVDLEQRKPLDLAGEEKKLDAIAEEQQSFRERQRVLQVEILKYEDIERQLDLYGANLPELGTASRYSFIVMEMGKIRGSELGELEEELKDIPSVTVTMKRESDEVHLLVVYMKRDAEAVRKILVKHGWETVELAHRDAVLREDLTRDIGTKLAALRNEQREAQEKAKRLLEQRSRELQEIWAQLRVHELFYRIQTYFKKTSRTMLFTGYLPAEKRGVLAAGIKKAAGGNCYLEWQSPKEGAAEPEGAADVPVQFRNPKFLQPFQMLVSNFGIPQYGTVDPTLFVMVIYLIMFGLMFSDVGQGALLVLAGFFGAFFFKPLKETWKNLSHLMIWCGVSAILSGFLFGSFFGTDLIRPLWFDYHGIVRGSPHKTSLVNSVFDILTITIYFGIAVIYLGLIFNWINLFIKKRWGELILEKSGIIGAWIYAGGIYVAYYMIKNGYKKLPGSAELFWLVGLPAVLLLLKGPVHFLLNKEYAQKQLTVSTLMNFGMEGLVGLLEVFTGYLSNTLSFMRVAGLGIAHVSLMAAFFEISAMVSPGGTAGSLNPMSVLVLIFGNILVIGLEGLTAGIQSLRLNYYEFFTKFFRGSGERYSPISLKSRDE